MPGCPVCTNFNPGSAHDGPPDGGSVSKIVYSASKGCHSCKVLKECIEGLLDIQDESEYTFHLAVRDGSEPGTCYLDLEVSKKGYKSTGIQIYRQADSCPWDIFSRIEDVSSSSSDESLTWVQQQVQECLNSHQDCDIASSFFPTRVIDVDCGKTIVKVVEGLKGEDYGQGKYIALSHCWGDPKHMTTKLTMHTLKDYKSEIPVSSLPQTFKDTVEFTRNMGIRYLWIDSLCIIQPDKEKDTEKDRWLSDKDWMQESKRMCSVYENSYLTVAAASGSGCRDGLFRTPKRAEVEGCTPNGNSYHLFAREVLGHYSSDFPLMKRGWVFQESLISPRTLYFGRQELLWQCREVSTCQCTGLEDWDEPEDDYPDFLKLPTRHDPELQAKVVNKWHQLIQVYAQTTLTYQSDKLAAVEGLCQYILPLRKGKYLAGLWEDSLARDLLWKVGDSLSTQGPVRTEEKKSEPRKTQWSAKRWLFPTWSWASVTGRLLWDLDGMTKGVTPDTFHIRKCDEPLNMEPGYELKLESVLVPAKLRALQQRGMGFSQDYDLQKKGKGFVSSDTTVYCLRVFFLELEREYRSLVLHRFDNAEDVYERIGFLEHEGSNPPQWWESSEKEWKPKKQIITLV
ncbi:HET domain-containing protein [Fusarium sp. Ph1]|nr:HET domain-containing protein [Fusarium sp. Ph1]